MRTVPSLCLLLVLGACDGGVPTTPTAGAPSTPSAPAAPTTPATPSAPSEPVAPDGGSPAAPANPATPATPATPAAAAADWTAGVVDVSRDAGLPGVVAAVRVGAHEGYERVVFELTGDAVPGYHVEYVDEPVRHCTSGATIPVPGDAWLQVTLKPAHGHTEAGVATEVPPLPGGLTVVRAVERTCDFEAVATWVVGVATPNRFKVTELSGPARLVVDIQR